MSVSPKALGRLFLALLGVVVSPVLASAQVSLPRSPTGVAGYYVQASTQNRNNVQNATGTFVFIVWNGPSAETDTLCATDSTCAPYWQGYRVRRTIEGISPGRLEVVGQWKARDTVVPLCLAQQAPCDLQHFTFTGTGLFFKGFQNNQISPGVFALDYPKGNPVDADPDARIFIDAGAIVGFRSEYAVTSIDTIRVQNSDFYESPVDSSEIVHLTPATPPASNLEQVAVVPNPFKESAEWDPAPNQRRVHFIHLPANSTVRIYTSAGELLRTLKQDPNSSPGGTTGELEWDLKNEQGNSVVSGIYLYSVHPPDGRTPKKGHFVIIK